MRTLRLALVRAVLHDDPARLRDLVSRARSGGAELVMLPELPFLPWRPAFERALDDDAEPLHGRTLALMAEVAAQTGCALLGGAIVRDERGARHNTALLVDAGGRLAATYRKLHLPSEPGFWEDRHYVPGEEPPRVVDGFRLRLGIQICSDVNRPQGSQMLGAMGAEALLCPRATEARTFDRWRLMLRANAIASCAWVASVTRPAPEFGVPLGGPSIVVAPDGEVVLETEDEIAWAELTTARVTAARRDYPGYLAVRPDLYARGWSEVGRGEPDRLGGEQRDPGRRRG